METYNSSVNFPIGFFENLFPFENFVSFLMNIHEKSFQENKDKSKVVKFFSEYNDLPKKYQDKLKLMGMDKMPVKVNLPFILEKELINQEEISINYFKERIFSIDSNKNKAEFRNVILTHLMHLTNSIFDNNENLYSDEYGYRIIIIKHFKFLIDRIKDSFIHLDLDDSNVLIKTNKKLTLLKNEKISFQPRSKTQVEKLIPKIYNLHVNEKRFIINENSGSKIGISLEDFRRVFLADDIKTDFPKIQFGCSNKAVAYIISKIKFLFENLEPNVIEKTKIFLLNSGLPATSKILSSAKDKNFHKKLKKQHFVGIKDVDEQLISILPK